MLSLLLSLNFIQPAFAFEINENDFGEETQWFSSTIKYGINFDGDHGLSADLVEEAIVDAGEAWHDHGGNIEFSYQGESKSSRADYTDGEFTVTFVSNWTADPDVLALTHIWSTESGEIVHFDIEINDNHEWSTDGDSSKNDLMNAMTHEFGHAIGISHSDIDEATMYESAQIGEILKRDLSDDDIEGLVHLYSGTNSQEGSTNTSTENSPGGSNAGGGSAGNNPTSSGGGGGSLAPIESSGCSTLPALPGLMSILIPLFALRRRKE